MKRSMQTKIGPGRTQGTSARAQRLTVSDDTRTHLVDDIAYFRATTFRDVKPGEYRRADRRAAETALAAMLARNKGRKK